MPMLLREVKNNETNKKILILKEEKETYLRRAAENKNLYLKKNISVKLL